MDNQPLIPARHPSLPQGITNAVLAEWLKTSAAETFTHEKRRYFSELEISDMEHESSAKGREMNRLTDVMKEIQDLIKKGNEEPASFTIPETVGTKMLETHRRENDDFIEKGYANEEITVYGIPNGRTDNMDYFDEEGNEITERRRALTAKEKHKYNGFFQRIQGGIDTVTGEVFGNTGN